MIDLNSVVAEKDKEIAEIMADLLTHSQESVKTMNIVTEDAEAQEKGLLDVNKAFEQILLHLLGKLFIYIFHNIIKNCSVAFRFDMHTFNCIFGFQSSLFICKGRVNINILLSMLFGNLFHLLNNF